MTSRADALYLVEAIELLVDAGQWQAADDLYQARTDGGRALVSMAAARLGQRAASAFVATAARRDTCRSRLGPRILSIYLKDAGMYAISAGDLATAQAFLPMSVRQARDDAEGDLPLCLQILAWCLGYLGQTDRAWDAAAEALTRGQAQSYRPGIRNSHAFLGWLAGLAGDTAEAERQFIAADQIEFADDPNGNHLYSLRGNQWAEWLVRTGRLGPARTLISQDSEICRSNGWHADLARCDRQLGRLALIAGDHATAGKHLAAAAGGFRDGDYLTELADTLADLAEHARVTGDIEAAERHVTEAITIAAPRGLVPAQSAALAARVRIRTSQAAATSDPDHVAQGRDAADAALRLATSHHLAWHELDALSAHAALDDVEHVGHGWAAKADALHARLVPPGLDPDPLATVERLVAAEKGAVNRLRRLWRR